MKLNVTSKLYDLKKAKKICSTSNGFCRLKLEFPKSQYVLLTTPDNVRLQLCGINFISFLPAPNA